MMLTRALNKAMLVLILCCLLLQLGLAVISFAQYQSWMREHITASTETQASQELLDSLADAIASNMPRGSTILYVSRDADEEYQTYFWLTYALYPSPVWWVSARDRTSPEEWWTPSPVTAGALTALARKHNARYLLLDGLDAPGELRPSSSLDLGPGLTLVVLP
jgi:hypothetical protein